MENEWISRTAADQTVRNYKLKENPSLSAEDSNRTRPRGERANDRTINRKVYARRVVYRV